MSNKYKFHNPDGCDFVTFTVVGWIDACLADRQGVYKKSIQGHTHRSWKHCQKNKGLVIHAYVIMTNHVHMIISRNSKVLLEDIMRDMKKFTAVSLLAAIQSNVESRREWMLNFFGQAGAMNSNNKHFQFWLQDNHPIECSTPLVLKQKMEYIHENPVRAGFVEKAEDWVYNSAGDYYKNKKELVEIDWV